MKRILFVLTFFISFFAQAQYLNQPAKWKFLYIQKYNFKHALMGDSDLVYKLYVDSVAALKGTVSSVATGYGVTGGTITTTGTIVVDTATLSGIWVRKKDTFNTVTGYTTLYQNSLKLSATTAAITYLPLAGGTMVGNIIATDNTYDLGASGATRFRTGYFGTSLVSPTLIGGSASAGNLTLQATSNATKGYVGIDYAPTATANRASLVLGSPFDGSTSGFFTGSANGTHLAINTATGTVPDFANFQLAGAARFQFSSAGVQTNNVTASTTSALKLYVNGGAFSGMELTPRGDFYSFNGSTFRFYAADATTINMSMTSAAITMNGKITNYNNIATTGNGVPSIYGSGRSTGQTLAVASVATYTVAAADASFTISANVNVTTSSAEAFTVTCAYTDETNTARTLTMPFILLAGTTAAAINFANGAVPYEGLAVHIRCKASTAITIATTGTFTGATYNVEGNIIKTN